MLNFYFKVHVKSNGQSYLMETKHTLLNKFLKINYSKKYTPLKDYSKSLPNIRDHSPSGI